MTFPPFVWITKDMAVNFDHVSSIRVLANGSVRLHDDSGGDDLLITTLHGEEAQAFLAWFNATILPGRDGTSA